MRNAGITEELKELETKILEADEKVHTLEQSLYVQLLEDAQAQVPALLKNAKIMAVVDVLLTFAHLAQRYHWVRPTFASDLTWKVSDGRHPSLSASFRMARPMSRTT